MLKRMFKKKRLNNIEKSNKKRKKIILLVQATKDVIFLMLKIKLNPSVFDSVFYNGQKVKKKANWKIVLC